MLKLDHPVSGSSDLGHIKKAISSTPGSGRGDSRSTSSALEEVSVQSAPRHINSRNFCAQPQHAKNLSEKAPRHFSVRESRELHSEGRCQPDSAVSKDFLEAEHDSLKQASLSLGTAGLPLVLPSSSAKLVLGDRRASVDPDTASLLPVFQLLSSKIKPFIPSNPAGSALHHVNLRAWPRPKSARQQNFETVQSDGLIPSMRIPVRPTSAAGRGSYMFLMYLIVKTIILMLQFGFG